MTVPSVTTTVCVLVAVVEPVEVVSTVEVRVIVFVTGTVVVSVTVPVVVSVIVPAVFVTTDVWVVVSVTREVDWTTWV